MKKFTKVMPKNWSFSVAGAFTFGLIFNYFAGTDWLRLIVFSVLAAAGACASLFFMNRHDVSLISRTRGSMLVWDVWISGGKIGTITDSRYAEIQRTAYGDGRLIFDQIINLSHVVLNVIVKVLISVPLLMFWLFVVISIATPESITEIAHAWRTADPVALADNMRILFQRAIMFFSVLTVGILLAFGHRFGFRNLYSEAVVQMIRQHFNLHTDGIIHLSKIEKTVEQVAHS